MFHELVQAISTSQTSSTPQPKLASKTETNFPSEHQKASKVIPDYPELLL
jgi:hypothetical protein